MFAALKKRPLWQRIAVIGGALVALLVLVAAVVYWLVVPEMAARVVRDRLASLEERTALVVEFDRVNTSGLSGVTITDITVDTADGARLLTLEEASAGLDTGALLAGQRHISRVDIRGMEVTVHRRADGSTNIEELLESLRGESTSSSDGTATDADGDGPGFLGPFGGEFPDVTVKNSRVLFTADEGAPPWAVDKLETAQFAVDSSGDAAEYAGTVGLTRGRGHQKWQLPEKAEILGELALPLKSSDLQLTFDTPLLVSGLSPEPMLRAGVAGLEVRDGSELSVQGLELALQGPTEATRLAEVGAIDISVNHFTTDLDDLRVLKVKISDPTIHIQRSFQGGSGWNDLLELTRGQTARRVAGRTRAIAREIALDEGLELEEEESGTSLADKLGAVDWNDLLANRAPQSVDIENIQIHVRDDRPTALLKPRREIALDGGRVNLSHRALQGELKLVAGFDATGEGGADLGSTECDIRWSYRTGMLDLDIGVEGIHLGWLVQLTGRPLDDEIQAGVVHTSLKASRKNRDSKMSFKGLFALEDGSVHLEALTQEPITDLDTSYTFAGYFDPNADIPEPELLRVRSYLVDEPRQPTADNGTEPPDSKTTSDDDEEAEPKPPRRGALVFTEGAGLLNGVKATFKPALYGIKSGHRPSRFDVQIELPERPVMDLFDAVPSAIKGPLDGTKMSGSFAWNFRAEVPLYEAGDMEWEARTNLKNFELLSMPRDVDVRRMKGAMTHTIIDERIEFERTIQIPEMRPVPLQWLVDNTDMPEETFVERRVEREWPPRDLQTGQWRINPRPDPFARERTPPAQADEGHLIGRNPGDDEATDASESPKPEAMVKWKGKKKPHPYGRYRYVPLHHISPWMPRAVMTTEDNSFFDHGGFNWFALKESVEDNLDAGGFVRGASTVSMQLVKNLFLSRDKVIARKLREAFLVWVMERVVDIPKSRIMELYLNIIEFGPGIFGINDAAVHYFGKRPNALSVTEVAWLVSVVPNPKKYHFYYERGEISDAWFRRMMRYIEIMRNRHRATDADVERARDMKPNFYRPADGEPMIKMRDEPPATKEDSWFDFTGFGRSKKASSKSSLPDPAPVPLEGTAGTQEQAEDEIEGIPDLQR